MHLKNYFIQLAKDILIRFPKKVVGLFSYLGEWRAFKNKNDNRFSVSAGMIKGKEKKYPVLFT